MQEKRKEIALGVLLVLLIVVFWARLGGGLGSGPSTAGAGGRATRVNLEALRIYPVPWEILTAARPAYDPAGRNIFQFGALPKPTPPPMSDAEKAAVDKAKKDQADRLAQLRAQQMKAIQDRAEQQRNQPQEPVNVLPPEPPKPRPPQITYKFVGYIGPPENKLAVLDDGGDLLFARAGDNVGEQFRIMEIGYESIKFGYTDDRFVGESRTIPMSTSTR